MQRGSRAAGERLEGVASGGRAAQRAADERVASRRLASHAGGGQAAGGRTASRRCDERATCASERRNAAGRGRAAGRTQPRCASGLAAQLDGEAVGSASRAEGWGSRRPPPAMLARELRAGPPAALRAKCISAPKKSMQPSKMFCSKNGRSSWPPQGCGHAKALSWRTR